MSLRLKRTARAALVAYNLVIGPFLAFALIATAQWWWAIPVILVGHAIWMTSTLWPQCAWFGDVWVNQTDAGSSPPDSVWLTVDDGPHPEDTPALLDLLDKHSAKATFFFIGRHAARHPKLVREVIERGHTVGNHTMTHDQYRFWAYGPGGCRREVEDCQRTLAELGVQTRYFRAPAGLKSPFLQAAVERAGLTLVCWTARGLDGILSDRAKIMERLKATTRSGGIVLVHEGRADEDGVRIAPDVMRSLLEWLDQQGLRCVLPDTTA